MTEVLPSKLLPIARTLVGQGSVILEVLVEAGLSVGQLWIHSKERLPGLTYEEFVDALSLLYAAKIVNQIDGVIARSQT